jgi:hypothetical protein
VIDYAVYILAHHWEFTLQEIGDLFAVTESRISQRLSLVEARVFAALQKEERRPDEEIARRLAEDAQGSGWISAGLASLGEAKREGAPGGAHPSVASEEPGALEGDHEEVFPEWFA